MKNLNNMFPSNPASHIKEFYNENPVEITQDTDFRRTIISIIKEINKFKGLTKNSKN